MTSNVVAQPRYVPPHMRSSMDELFYGVDLDGSLEYRDWGGAAGKSTQRLNNSFAGRIPGTNRGFLLDDYGEQNQACRKVPRPDLVESHCWGHLQYTDTKPWVQKSGTDTTRFHKGFQRKQYPEIKQDAPRKAHEEFLENRAAATQEYRKGYLADRQTLTYNGYNIITGEDFNPAQERRKRAEALHVTDHKTEREQGPGADKPAFRLKDSTSRFFCTDQQMPQRGKRVSDLGNEGLSVTKRQSAILGVGNSRLNQNELVSYGVDDNFKKSFYAEYRKNAPILNPTQRRIL